MENEKRRCRLSAGVNERVIAKSLIYTSGRPDRKSDIESLDLERIGVPVILPVQFSEQDIISRPDTVQIQRYGQLCLIADSTGDSCGIGDAAIALFVTNDHDRVRSGFAETRKDQIHMQEGCGQIDRLARRLIFCTAIRSVIGEIERPLHGW